MLISNFNEEVISFGDAQFAISIALSQMGEDEAAHAVLVFKATYANNETETESSRRYYERTVIQKELSQEKCGMVRAVLNLLDKPNTLSTIQKGEHRVQRFHSLSELLQTCTVNQVYLQTMNILARYRTTDLIVLYMNTPEFWGYFSSDIRKRMGHSADGIRKNDLSDQILSEILQDFKDWIARNSANGVYYTGSGAPGAFLRNAFNTMYSISKDTKFYNILNSSGLNKELGSSDGASFMSFLGIENSIVDNNFDFIDVANKINRASALLFSHNNKAVSFYDIFSCFRDKQLQNRLKDAKNDLKIRLPGNTFIGDDSSSDLGVGHDGAVRNKKSSRMTLCSVFEPIIRKGLAQSEIYSYYQEAIDCTENQTTKDGARLFSTPSHTTKHYESNSEMVQIIISGYLAVRDLIIYLENNPSISSVYSFPTIIFRDARYLRRFQTIQEYVDYVSEVSVLVDEVTFDNQRNQVNIEGFIDNDSIWNYLGTKNLTRDTIYRKLYDLPLGFITNAIASTSMMSKDERLLQSLRIAKENFQEVNQHLENYTRQFNTYLEYWSGVEFLGHLMHDADFEEYDVTVKYAIVLAFCKQLNTIMHLEGNPILDAQGNYCLKQPSFLEEVKHLFVKHKAFAEQSQENLLKVKNMCILRARALAKAYEFLIGEPVVGFNCTWEQTRLVFALVDLLCETTTVYNKNLAQNVSCNKKDLYLTLARIAKQPEVYKIPKVFSSCSDFSFLCGQNMPSYNITGDYSVDEIMQFNRHRNAVFISAMNRFFNQVCPQREDFSIAFDLVDRYVSKRHSPIVVEEIADKLLTIASYELGSLAAYDKNKDVKSRLEGMLKFDDQGYAVKDGERCRVDEFYILRFGYFVRIDYVNNVYSSEVINLEDITRMRLSLLAT